jgi:D-beta-D-heptose 7-phosphate kinase/D-beta-D-heptose 1-phosphate adenosyltransferase
MEGMRFDTAAVDDLYARWRGLRILVVGDIMLDRYLWGRVDRISPEAPVPVVDVTEETVRLGGAANVARNVLALGAAPRLVGVVGEDATAAMARAELRAAGLAVDDIVGDPSRPTTLKTRIVARSQHVVRADQESRALVDDGITKALVDTCLGALPQVHGIILSDYGKGVITQGLLEALLAAARSRRLPVCVDPKDTHFFSYRGVSVLTPNQHEAGEVLGWRLRDEAALERAGREILGRLESDCVLITRGERGMSLFERGGARTDLPALARHVYDVTGAGDTVVSAYAVALAGGASPRAAAHVSNHAAGLVVGEVGTAVPSLEDLRRSLAGAGR